MSPFTVVQGQHFFMESKGFMRLAASENVVFCTVSDILHCKVQKTLSLHAILLFSRSTRHRLFKFMHDLRIVDIYRHQAMFFTANNVRLSSFTCSRLRERRFTAVQGHPRSSKAVPFENTMQLLANSNMYFQSFLSHCHKIVENMHFSPFLVNP